jgi:hypothetical protein
VAVPEVMPANSASTQRGGYNSGAEAVFEGLEKIGLNTKGSALPEEQAPATPDDTEFASGP